MRKLAALAVIGLSVCASAQFYGNEKSIQPIDSGRRAYQAPDSEIGVDQKLNDVVPMNLSFTDSSGKAVKLRDLFRGKPVVLMPVFYECGGVCTLELNGMVEALRDFKKDYVGEDFDVVTFTIKPTETVEQAAEKKAYYLDIYNRVGAEDGWHFLVGDLQDIKSLTDAIGFRYTYDAETGAVLHPACAVVLSPEGQVSQYFLETSYNPSALLDSIMVAAKGRVGRKVEADTFWNCVNVDPLTGQKSLNVMKALRLAGLATLIAVAGAIVFMSVKYKYSSADASAAKSVDGGGTES